jgi:hypothetical protein
VTSYAAADHYNGGAAAATADGAQWPLAQLEIALSGPDHYLAGLLLGREADEAAQGRAVLNIA